MPSPNWSGHRKMIDPPWRTSTYEGPFTWDGNYVVYLFILSVFHRKDLCEAKHEMQSVFKFGQPGGRSTGRSYPPVCKASWGKYFPGRSSGRSTPP